jgi:branched-chain amino acid transport system substrate-binding protein
MALGELEVGFLFSSSGSYELVARSMLNGALLAAEEVNGSGLGIRIEPSICNPGGDLSQYSAHASTLLKRGIRHVVGCYTSSARKEVIPLFEKHDALLWYPSHYEGFESSNNVIYTGAAPISMSCRWWNICCSTTATAHSASAPTTSGPGRTIASCARA